MYVTNKFGFTLIEMMIVLSIISVLLLIAVPNMTKNHMIASEKGCQATIDLLQSQVGAYELEKNVKLNSLEPLLSENYVERITCPNQQELILVDGKVVKK